MELVKRRTISTSKPVIRHKNEEPDPETEENGEEYQKREEELERLVKKNNQLEVANLLIVLATAMTNLGTAKKCKCWKVKTHR